MCKGVLIVKDSYTDNVDSESRELDSGTWSPAGESLKNENRGTLLDSPEFIIETSDPHYVKEFN
jgi:hypothetical protein